MSLVLAAADFVDVDYDVDVDAMTDEITRAQQIDGAIKLT